ncbi:LPS assembly protein LptD [Microbulbifer sp. OS29]|uniref:LPS-assembly protein LptD n=1 Tax=Microbulbifer okhotskensis TaxID=2926617 RepID=A0A9X2J3E7_9GAMM|nr:LPS assembly protein LptD [Microbulbifer okhotskensis]MCO1333462.1 LPS assembly protein LptD [Microbulbifer okhotskensis]
MLEVSRWRRLALAIARNSHTCSIALGLIAAQPLWAQTNQSELIPDPDYNPYLYLDWLPRSELTAEEQANLPAVCSGTFVAPPRNYPGSDLPPGEASLRATAEKSQWLEDGSAKLSGNVHITQGYRQLFADQVRFNRQENVASLDGAIELREPNLLIRGASAEVHTNSEAASIEDATYVVHDAFIHGDAALVARQTSGELTLTEGTYTRCEPGREFWRLTGDEINIDKVENQGTARNVRLEILDVPILYLPYFRFPVGDARMSGFLFPSLSNSDKNGWDFTIPYYWNIAPQMDATISPRHIQYRGTGLEVEFRHLSEMFSTEIRLADLPDDDGGNNDLAQELIDEGFPENLVLPYKGEDRWLASLKQQGGYSGSVWRTDIDYTKVSDPDYFRDLSTASLDINAETRVNQKVQGLLRSDHWQITLRTQDYQVLENDSFDVFAQYPRFDVDGDYRWGDWLLSMQNQATVWDHQDTQTITYIGDTDDPDSVTTDIRDFITADRLRLDYEFFWDKQWLWGYFKPGVAGRYLSYKVSDQFLAEGANDSPSAAAAQFTLDTGLYFERDSYIFDRDFIQTLEPRLFTLISSNADQGDFFDISDRANDINPDIEIDPDSNNLLYDTSLFTFSYDQLFRNSRFTGSDRIDDADRLALGLTTRFIDPISGRDLFSASIGQVYYSSDRQIGRTAYIEDTPRSELAARIESRPFQSLRLGTEVVYEDSEHNINRGNFSLRYFDDDFRIFNLSYYYERPDATDDDDIDEDDNDTVSQLNASTVLPLNTHTSFMAGASYDLTLNRELEYLAGIEYDDCCYRTRLVWRRTLDNDLAGVVSAEDLEYDEGIYLEIELKGLAGFGATVTEMLTQGIANFDQREELKQ